MRGRGGGVFIETYNDLLPMFRSSNNNRNTASSSNTTNGGIQARIRARVREIAENRNERKKLNQRLDKYHEEYMKRCVLLNSGGRNIVEQNASDQVFETYTPRMQKLKKDAWNAKHNQRSQKVGLDLRIRIIIVYGFTKQDEMNIYFFRF